MTLKNTTSSDIKEIYYDRTLDPDNTSTMGGIPGVVTSPGPVTKNVIEYKLPNAKSRTLVSATSVLTVQRPKAGGGLDTVDYPVYLGIGSKDCRARPYTLSAGLLFPGLTDSPGRLYNNDNSLPAAYLFDSGETNTADAATGLVFHIDHLGPGDSTSFFMAYVLSTADLDSAFADMSPTWSYDGKEYQSGDTVKLCRSGSAADERKKLNIVGGEDYTWTWPSRPGLEHLTGTENSILLTNTPVTYIARPSEGVGCMDSMTLTIMPYINPTGPTAPSPVYYCQHDKAVPLTATPGSAGVLRWYDRPDGPPSSSITPATNEVGTKVYYVSVQNGICESDRTPVTVVTRPLPGVKSVAFTSPTYCNAKDGTITLELDSANSSYILYYDIDGLAAGPLTIKSDSGKRYILTGLGGGDYEAFYVINKYGCKGLPFYGPVTLIDPIPSTPPVLNNGPLCADQLAVLTAPRLDSVVYSWTGPDGFSSSDVSPSFITKATSGGTYVLTVRKKDCVYKPSSTTLVISPTPKHQDFAVQHLCEGAELRVPYLYEPATDYLWTGKGVTQFNQDLLIGSVTQANNGPYILTATSAGGCVTTDTVHVTVDAPLQVTYSNDTTICSGDSISLFVSSGGPTVLWSPATGLSNAASFTPKAAPKETTTYQVLARSGGACPDVTNSVTVSVLKGPEVQGYDTLVRMNVPYTIMPLYGQDAIKWHWVPSDSLSCADCANPVFTSRTDKTYMVYVSNALGCTSSDTVTIRVFCDGASVTMPNAFTPNGDGHNDLYYVRGHGFSVKQFVIYNRLGQEVFHKEHFEPNDKNFGWDGTFNGAQITEAAGFVYMLEVQCYNSGYATTIMKGTVLLIR